jgi:hypothetical protein
MTGWYSILRNGTNFSFLPASLDFKIIQISIQLLQGAVSLGRNKSTKG